MKTPKVKTITMGIQADIAVPWSVAGALGIVSGPSEKPVIYVSGGGGLNIPGYIVSRIEKKPGGSVGIEVGLWFVEPKDLAGESVVVAGGYAQGLGFEINVVLGTNSSGLQLLGDLHLLGFVLVGTYGHEWEVSVMRMYTWTWEVG